MPRDPPAGLWCNGPARSISIGEGCAMSDDAAGSNDLRRRLGEGDRSALGELFARHRDRLARLVRLRLDPRLVGRLDPSDVVQEAFVDASRRFADYHRDPAMPVFIWLRFLVVQRLQIA